MLKNVPIIAIFATVFSAYAWAVTCPTGQTADASGVCMTPGQHANTSNNALKTRMPGFDIYQTTGATIDAAEQAREAAIFGTSNTGNQGLDAAAQAQIDACRNYVPDPQNPNPRKDAQCKATNDYRKHQSASISKSHAAFGGQRIADVFAHPESMVTPATSTQSSTGCTTSTGTIPASRTEGQCIVTAQPTATACTQSTTVSASILNYCNVVTSKWSVGRYLGGTVNDPNLPLTKDNLKPISEMYSGLTGSRYWVEYACGPRQPNGDILTIVARLWAKPGVFPSVAPDPRYGPPPPCFNGGCPAVQIEFTPGTSRTETIGMVGYKNWTSNPCSGWGNCDQGNVIHYYAGISYDGVSDTVFINSIPEGTPDHISCYQGQPGSVGSSFVAQSLPYQAKVVIGRTSPGINGRNIYGVQTLYGVPSHCALNNGQIAYVQKMPTVLESLGTVSCCTTGRNGGDNYLSCPVGYNYFGDPNQSLSGNAICQKLIAPTPPTNPVGDTYVLTASPPLFTQSGSIKGTVAPYSYVLQSALDRLILASPAPQRIGGAGMKTTISLQTNNSTPSCESLQAKSSNTTSSGLSYDATLSTVYNCPSGWLVDGVQCTYFPPQYPIIKTDHITCEQGQLVNGHCEYQPPSYPAPATNIYSCATGDTITGGTCPNGGVKAGETCQYPSVAPTSLSVTCGTGLTAVNDLCYTNIALAAANNAVDNVSIFNPLSIVYNCPSGTVNVGVRCEKPTQTITCDHQPADISGLETYHYQCRPSISGNYTLTYLLSGADTNPTGLCIANQITKPSNLQSITCPANYTWNATANQCEYQMPDYTASQTTDCYTANLGNTGTAYVLSNGICSKTTTYTAY